MPRSRVDDDLVEGRDADVGVGDERDAVLDGELADELGVRAFVIVLVAGQDVDDEIEAVGLEVGENVGRAAVGDLVDLGRS